MQIPGIEDELSSNMWGFPDVNMSHRLNIYFWMACLIMEELQDIDCLD